MKKLVLIAAAVAAIASCAKVETVSTTGPKLISFKSIDAPMTKTKSPDKLTTSMGVNAIWNHGNEERDEYFNNAEFTQENLTNVWSGKQYWPKTGTLDFIVYAPYVAGSAVVKYDQGLTSATVTFPMTDASANILYGEKLYRKQKGSGNISVNLKHATAQVIVNAKTDLSAPEDLYKITGISFADIYLQGSTKITYTVASPDAAPAVEYTQTGSAEALTAAPNQLVTASNVEFFNKFIMPHGTQTSFTVSYSVKTGESNYVPADPITFDLTSPETAWAVNTKYIFNLTFTANEIKFEPTVEDWTDGPAFNENVEPQPQPQPQL